MSDTYDLNGDGFIDAASVDQDGDGFHETAAWDTDQNGTFDVVGIDTNGNGTFEAAALDLDGDGLLDDAGWLDADENGVPEGVIGDVPGLTPADSGVDVALNDLVTSQLFESEGVDHTFGGV